MGYHGHKKIRNLLIDQQTIHAIFIVHLYGKGLSKGKVRSTQMLVS